MRYKMHGIGAGSAHANIVFGICSYARRVTINFLEHCAYGLAA